MNRKVIGILGGMGPEATHEIFGRIIKYTNANVDKDHIRLIIDNNPKIPDRTEAIINGGLSPLEELISTARNLQRAGASYIIIPCMTAHYFIEDIQGAIGIPIINALLETKKYLNSHYPQMENIGLLATSGTVKTNLFQRHIVNRKILVPGPLLQRNEVMDVIYGKDGIKAGNTSSIVVDRLTNVVSTLKERGAQGIISGCTEISLVMPKKILGLPLIDPMDILAKEAVRLAEAL